jgi:hypothetical protein
MTSTFAGLRLFWAAAFSSSFLPVPRRLKTFAERPRKFDNGYVNLSRKGATHD